MESANSSLDQPQNPENAALSNGKKREFVCPDCQLTLRSRNLEIPVVECELPTATEDLPQPAEQPSEQTAVENSLDGMPAKSAQKRSQRVVPVQPFERRELFGSDDDEEETSMLIGPSNPKIRKMSAPSIAVPSGSHTGEAAARLNGESSALSVSQSGEETAGWSVRLRSQDATNSKSQPVKEDLRQAPLFESEDEEEAEGGDTSGDFDSSQPKNSAMLDCSVCGLPVAVQHFRKHSKGHSRKIGWQCALCGIRVATQRKRREHEDGFHALRRCRFDQDRQEAILLDEPQLKTLRSIGTNFREIQRGAVRSVAAFIQLPTLLAASRQASGGATESRRPTDVVVLDD
ncbi:hypothetical protein M3Y99_00902100 [Aphelenchoides fujianensis]|nr:hypothetical protein M3Y99_00902100 [Aphelenchoides fujianensis]